MRASLLRRSTCSVGLPGLVAQGESVRLTRGRSLVRSQSGPQHKVAVKRLFLDFELILWSPPSGPIRPNLSALVDLQVVQRVQSRSRIVEFVAVEICIDVRGHGGRRVAHRLLQQPQIVHTQRRGAVFSKGRELDLPVVGAVVPGVGAAAGVLHDDGITGAEVVEEPPCVGGADVDTAMADVALALVIH